MNFEMDNFRKNSEKELYKELAEKHSSIREARFAIANNYAKNTKEIRGLKKNAARILTSLKERQRDGRI